MMGSLPAVNDSRAGGNWTGKLVDALTFGEHKASAKLTSPCLAIFSIIS